MSKAEALEKLEQRVLDELSCSLKTDASHLVFGRGNPNAAVMLIGEAPGAQEELAGLPFVGKAGKELDRLLNQIGLAPANVYIANLLKYRPQNNRDPRAEEIGRHSPYLVEQIIIIHPRIIVTLGNWATKFVLSGFDPAKMKEIQGIGALHGKQTKVQLNGTIFLVVPTYHPATLLYRPKLREEIERDFRLLRALYDRHGP